MLLWNRSWVARAWELAGELRGSSSHRSLSPVLLVAQACEEVAYWLADMTQRLLCGILLGLLFLALLADFQILSNLIHRSLVSKFIFLAVS
jgi:hypothetical protein